MKNKKAELIVESLLRAPKGIAFEAGCIREDHEVVEDGFSTPFIVDVCVKQKRLVMSCDTEQAHVDIANAVLKERGLPEVVQCLDAKHGIAVADPIAFLFLDSHRHPAFTLDQYRAAELVDGAIVIIDDAQPIDEFKFGKAQFVKDFFDFHGIPYEIIETHSNDMYTWASMVFTLEDGKPAGKMG